MLFRVIDKNEIDALVRGFAAAYEVIGPVQKGNSFAFDVIGDNPSRLCIEYETTLLPPKKYLMPPRETLFGFDGVKNTVSDLDYQARPRVLFGLHACDINAINRLDKVFLDEDYPDPYYRAHRNNTLIVGVSCMPSEHCFCAMWGSDEVSSGYDLFLHDIGDRYLVSVISVTASEILSASTSAREAGREDTQAFQEYSRSFKAAFKNLPYTGELSILMDASYEDPIWEELGQRCLSCGACSSVCPTCHCFDIQDSLSPDGTSGTRIRTWDSCCSPDFAAVAHGQNFRKTAAQRVRNRFYHKFLGYRAKYDEILCTGCGRCEIACKAQINPRVVIERLEHESERGGGKDA